MAVAVKKEANVGGPPGHLPLRNTFDWCFAQPFASENDFTPASHKLPHIEDSRPIFVDNQSGTWLFVVLGQVGELESCGRDRPWYTSPMLHDSKGLSHDRERQSAPLANG